MSFNGTYRACCCGGETEPCDCSLYQDCLNYLKQNCKFGECNQFIKTLKDIYCSDPTKEDSFICPIGPDNDGIFSEGINCEIKCSSYGTLLQTTTWSNPCNNEINSGFTGVDGLICGSTCEELYPGEGKILGYDGLCWSGNCIDESPNGSDIIQGSQTIKYITEQNIPCPKAIHVYFKLSPSENGCCKISGPSPGFFDGLDHLNIGTDNNTDNYIIQNILPDGDKCVNCQTCFDYIGSVLSGKINNENCPIFTCSDITSIENNEDFINCYYCKEDAFLTGEAKCPTPCTLINPFDCNEQDSYFIVNEILECGCPCGQNRVYNCQCVDCSGGKLSNCCEVEVEGFSFEAAENIFGISKCPVYPGDPCCDFPLYELPEQCACWGAVYNLEFFPGGQSEWILSQNKNPFRGCLTPCETIRNCYCSTFTIPSEPEPIYVSLNFGGLEEDSIYLKCDHFSVCCPCSVLNGDGSINTEISPLPLESSCIDNKGNAKCPTGYTFVAQDTPNCC